MITSPRIYLAAIPAFAAMLFPVAPRLHAEPQGTTVEVTVDAKNTLTLTANRETKTLDAAGRVVTITGNQNQLTLTGECRSLTVTGNDNVITVEAVTSLSLTGNRNQMTWTKGPGDGKPSVTDVGSGNNVTKRNAS